eukprot:s12_g2.t1
MGSVVKEGLLALVSCQLALALLRGSACNDPAGAARCLAAAAAGLLVALRPLPWPLLLHSAVCALGWLLEVGPWLLDFDTAWAILRTRGQTYFFVTMLGPPCWTLGLYVTLLLYIQRTSTERLPLYGAHGSSNAADQWGQEESLRKGSGAAPSGEALKGPLDTLVRHPTCPPPKLRLRLAKFPAESAKSCIEMQP